MNKKCPCCNADLVEIAPRYFVCENPKYHHVWKVWGTMLCSVDGWDAVALAQFVYRTTANGHKGAPKADDMDIPERPARGVYRGGK